MQKTDRNRSNRGNIWRIIIIIFLILISIFPAAMKSIRDTDSIIYKILGFLLPIGALILRWLTLSILFIIITAISHGFYNLILRPLFDDPASTDNGLIYAATIAIVAAFVIVLSYQFISGWLIDPGALGSVFHFIFPAYTPQF